ncbi:MAG TPA: AEC family transporter [Candidatus Pseudomonas excrementavium]|uniref:AEC family transporter n=1 Tax=Halopseudomonas bauzanensis TaxID=653930 RepID=UPI001C3BB870|nr:AEC family transporter [Halopseudomonas bauzanensis]HIZ50119.1 AEC family transporter [Candidatus Pseudomonas excrementavium]
MLSILSVTLPVFALILAGWLVRRAGLLGPHAAGEITRFVIYLALPALLFEVVASSEWQVIWQPGFVAAFGLGVAVVFGMAVILQLGRGKPLVDSVVDGLNAGYANTGFLGIPLLLAIIGRESLIPSLIATIITVCILFAVALIVIEVGLQGRDGVRPGHMLGKVGLQLLRNPLLVAPALGLLVLLFGLRIPSPVASFLQLLGGAASPCALVALGLFLAEERSHAQRVIGALVMLVVLKLVVQPLVTWWFAAQLFGLSALLVKSAVLLAALPTGTGPFMAAQLYQRDPAMTSNVILLSTVLSLLTISFFLHLVQ